MLTVSQLAKLANVAPNTVRNYVRSYPDLFGTAATPLKGERRFSEEDVATFCNLVALKASGMSLEEAADRLRTQEASPLIDVGATPLQEVAKAPQEGQDVAITLQIVLSAVQPQIDAMRQEMHQELATLRAQQGTRVDHIVTGIVIGFVAAIILMGLIARAP